MATSGEFVAASREKPMAIDSSSDAARGEPPSHQESECGDGRDGRVRLVLRRVAERCSHVARHEAPRCHQCRSRPRPRASPRIRHQRGSRRHRLVGRRGPRPEVPRLHECGARANHNSRPIQRPANSESRSRVVPRRRPALRGKRAPALAPRIAAGSCPAYSPQPAQTRSDAAGRRTMPACNEAGVPQADRRLRLG